MSGVHGVSKKVMESHEVAMESQWSRKCKELLQNAWDIHIYFLKLVRTWKFTTKYRIFCSLYVYIYRLKRVRTCHEQGISRRAWNRMESHGVAMESQMHRVAWIRKCMESQKNTWSHKMFQWSREVRSPSFWLICNTSLMNNIFEFQKHSWVFVSVQKYLKTPVKIK